MPDKRASADLAASEIASRQHGVVSIGQLTAVGLDKHAVSHRVRTGRLHRIHRGVCAVGHAALSAESLWMAAVLACGRGEMESGYVLDRWGAALSHRSAAVLWRMLPWRDGPIDVSIPSGGGRRRRTGIRLHRSLTLATAEVTLRSGIPVTKPARTIADLRRAAAVGGRNGLSKKDLRRAMRQADVLGLPCADGPDRDRTRSELERDFLRLCRVHGLPPPEVNVRIGRHLVDFAWRDRRLVVETDGYRYHRGRAAFEDDRARDLDLRAAGFEVIRLAEGQLRGDAPRVAGVLAAALRVGADVAGSA